MITVERGGAITAAVDGKFTGDVDAMSLGGRGQCARWNTVADVGTTRPPEQFIAVGRVIPAVLLGAP